MCKSNASIPIGMKKQGFFGTLDEACKKDANKHCLSVVFIHITIQIEYTHTSSLEI